MMTTGSQRAIKEEPLRMSLQSGKKSHQPHQSRISDARSSQIVFNAIESLRLSDAQNNMCFECGCPGPQWVSINNGIFICLQCAGKHRGFGVQVSFVRSLQMDNLTELQSRLLKFGGNRAFADFISLYDLHAEPIETLYFTKASQLYRDKLKEMAETD
jgi:hypothetical protein